MDETTAQATAFLDWQSICWALLLACITLACLWIQRRYPAIHRMGRGARILANLTIGYFGAGMLAFGAFSAATRCLPVPGGVAWEGGVALLGGLAACLIGGTTLVEHAVNVAALHRGEALVPAASSAPTR